METLAGIGKVSCHGMNLLSKIPVQLDSKMKKVLEEIKFQVTPSTNKEKVRIISVQKRNYYDLHYMKIIKVIMII